MIGLSIQLYYLIKDLSDDPNWIYEQKVSCIVNEYQLSATGSGGIARTVSIVSEGRPIASCDYLGLGIQGTPDSCEVKFPPAGKDHKMPVLAWTRHFFADEVNGMATPCFQPEAIARNTPIVDPLALYQPSDEKFFYEFHPDPGVCLEGIGVQMTEGPI